jgi:hypothetical protein
LLTTLSSHLDALDNEAIEYWSALRRCGDRAALADGRVITTSWHWEFTWSGFQT